MSLLTNSTMHDEVWMSWAAPTPEQLDHALGQVLLGTGAYEDAAVVLERACEARNVSAAALADLVEAALRSGQPSVAEAAAGRLRCVARRSGTEAAGLLARARGLMASDEDAEAFYRESLVCFEQVGDDSAAARTHLAYGEWLRRQHRRIDARHHLRRAIELFDARPPATFGRRARGELLAASETARKRTVDAAVDLTPRELQVVDEVSQGRTNREIAERLHLSPATVDFHLRKVFVKLGVRSRRQLFGTGPPLQ